MTDQMPVGRIMRGELLVTPVGLVRYPGTSIGLSLEEWATVARNNGGFVPADLTEFAVADSGALLAYVDKVLAKEGNPFPLRKALTCPASRCWYGADTREAMDKHLAAAHPTLAEKLK